MRPKIGLPQVPQTMSTTEDIPLDHLDNDDGDNEVRPYSPGKSQAYYFIGR